MAGKRGAPLGNQNARRDLKKRGAPIARFDDNDDGVKYLPTPEQIKAECELIRAERTTDTPEDHVPPVETRPQKAHCPEP